MHVDYFDISSADPIIEDGAELLVGATDPPIGVRGDTEFVADFLVPLAG